MRLTVHDDLVNEFDMYDKFLEDNIAPDDHLMKHQHDWNCIKLKQPKKVPKYSAIPLRNIFILDELGALELTNNILIFLFKRVRKVTLDNQNRMKCFCGHFEQTGIPCFHIFSVIKFIYKGWSGFSYHNVSIRWWTSYLLRTFDDKSALSQLFVTAIDNDVKGPLLRNHSLVNIYCLFSNLVGTVIYGVKRNTFFLQFLQFSVFRFWIFKAVNYGPYDNKIFTVFSFFLGLLSGHFWFYPFFLGIFPVLLFSIVKYSSWCLFSMVEMQYNINICHYI